MNDGGASSLDLRIGGMSCTACAARIEKAIGKMEGVSGVSVHYAGKSAHIRFVPELVGSAQIIGRIGRLGFTADPLGSERGGLTELAALRLRFVFAMLLTLPLLWTMAHHYAWLRAVPVPDMLSEPLLQLALASVVQFFVGMPFYFGAYYALRERTANMDVLVALGTTASFGYSYYAMMAGLPLYFETSAVVITAVLLGKLLEAAASERVRKESDSFATLRAKDALLVRGGTVERVPLWKLRPGDLLQAEAGQPLPADGIVAAGIAAVDESFLTGESVPVAKAAGDAVYAGTTANGPGLQFRVTACGNDTALSRIAALTREAQSAKSSLGRKVDRMAAFFVPAMLALSVLTLLLWLLLLRPGDAGAASVHALAVLLAACPCALGLAAPISLMLASGKLARRGIVLKEAGALERLAQLDTIVLDKTGTLTEGKPRVTGICAERISQRALLRLAAAAEKEAPHPFAAAIAAAAAQAGIDAPAAAEFKGFGGLGIEAAVDGKLVQIGNLRFAEHCGWQPGHAAQSFARLRERAGETVVYAAADGQSIGAIAFADPLKRSTPGAVAALRRSGIDVLLATGDYAGAARQAAGAAGIGDVHASMLPEDKVALIRRLQRQGRIVGMAGDGWNDAPALAAADVGMAMGGGVDASLEAGHLTLLRRSPGGIGDALAISRLTVRNIRQNLAFAFAYNAAVIPFAAFGGLEPWMAGTAMALSSVSVVGNALRLNGQMTRALNKRAGRLEG